jgi:hypothetical protein
VTNFDFPPEVTADPPVDSDKVSSISLSSYRRKMGRGCHDNDAASRQNRLPAAAAINLADNGEQSISIGDLSVIILK